MDWRRWVLIGGLVGFATLVVQPPARAQSAGSHPWYLAELNADDPTAVPSLADYKGELTAIAAGIFSSRQACEKGKQQFIAEQAKACSDPASCKQMDHTFNAALQCVRDNDPHWKGNPPARRWFAFFGFDSADLTCRSQAQVIAQRMVSVASASTDSECWEKAADFATGILGPRAQRNPPMSDCTYCLRGDAPVLQVK